MGLTVVKTRTQEVNQEIVEELEELLIRAKEGEFAGFAWGASLRDGAFKTGFTTSTDFPTLLAGVATLQHRLIITHSGVERAK